MNSEVFAAVADALDRKLERGGKLGHEARSQCLRQLGHRLRLDPSTVEAIPHLTYSVRRRIREKVA